MNGITGMDWIRQRKRAKHLSLSICVAFLTAYTAGVYHVDAGNITEPAAERQCETAREEEPGSKAVRNGLFDVTADDKKSVGFLSGILTMKNQVEKKDGKSGTIPQQAEATLFCLILTLWFVMERLFTRIVGSDIGLRNVRYVHRADGKKKCFS